MITFAISLTACASIMGGSRQEVKVSSEPIGAKIFVDGNEAGSTPRILYLKREKTHFIEIKQDGYQTFRLTTSKEINPWFWGNLLCGGIIGMVIDLATGNVYDIEPERIHAVLSKGDSALNLLYDKDIKGIDLIDENGKHIASVEIIWD